MRGSPRRSRAAAGATPAPLGPGEWKALLAERCRAGSVGALRLWRDTYGIELEPDEYSSEVERILALVPPA